MKILVSSKCYRRMSGRVESQWFSGMKMKMRYQTVKYFIIFSMISLIMFNICYFYMNLNDMSNRLKDKISKYHELLRKEDNYDKLLNLFEPIDQETANEERDYDSNDERVFKNLYQVDDSTNDSKKNGTNQIDYLIQKFINSSNLSNGQNKEVIERILKSFSYHLTFSIYNQTQNKRVLNVFNNLNEKEKLSDKKVSIKFRSTNIYRIDLNCFWTKTLDMMRPYTPEYTYLVNRNHSDVPLCPLISKPRWVEISADMPLEAFNSVQTKLYKKEIKITDEKFLSDLPTKQLINGGAWFPNFDFVKYEELKSARDYKHIFQLNTADYDCVPKERIAILVPMRGREDNLNNFLIHMHYFLQKQMKTYKIFVVEQINDDSVLFNKGRLYNTGFKYITEQEHEWEFNCVVLHDVDLLPLNLNLDYSCADMPRHMSIYVKRLSDYSLSPHYRFLTGGVLAVRPYHYKQINGYSNEYFGWGGEDDDLSIRIVEKELCVLRPPKNVSKYVMQGHHASIMNHNRWDLLMTATNRVDFDGLSNIHKLTVVKFVQKFYKYTRILVNVSAGH